MIRLFRLKNDVLDLCCRRCRRTLTCSSEHLAALSASSVTVNAPLIIQRRGNYCPSAGWGERKKAKQRFVRRQTNIDHTSEEQVEAGCGQTRAIWSRRLAEEKHLYWSHCVWVCVCVLHLLLYHHYEWLGFAVWTLITMKLRRCVHLRQNKSQTDGYFESLWPNFCCSTDKLGRALQGRTCHTHSHRPSKG